MKSENWFTRAVKKTVGRRITCCICLKSNKTKKNYTTVCQHCKQPIPHLYLQENRNLPISAGQVLGWSGHGKTTFFYGLTLVLEKMNCLWPNLSILPANESTLQQVRHIREYIQNGQMPDATAIEGNESYVLMLDGIPRWLGRTLVLRDLAGEHCDSLDINTKEVQFLLASPVTLFLFSPNDLMPGQSLRDPQQASTYSIDMLMSGYINTLTKFENLKANLNRKIVIALTKADKIRDLPDKLRDYLINDPIWQVVGRDQLPEDNEFPLFDIEAYLAGMQQVDGIIRRWIRREPGGGNLLALARKYGIELRFCVMTSTGGDIHPEKPTPWSPKRVLDPFFWTLELEKPH